MESSQLEIAIPYKSFVSRLGLFAFLLTAPVWCFVFGIVSAFYLVFLIFSFTPSNLLLELLSLSTFSICFLGTVAFSDQKIYLGRNGISLPLYMAPLLKFRRSRQWSELKAIELKGVRIEEKKIHGLLRIHFLSGGKALIDLACMPKEFVEKLLRAFDVWAPQCIKNQSLTDTQKAICEKNGGGQLLSYTQLWEEELRRRFFPTAFVPLEAGASLRDGSLIVVRQLAFGGLSAIYLAQAKNKELVILKESVVPVDAADEAKTKATEMFAREAKLLAKLSHERISKVRDYFVQDNRQYLVLEQISGQDTRQFVIQQGKQKSRMVLRWAQDIVEILQYLHKQEPPVVHRDVTPDNLLLGPGNRIHLIDFGASNEFLGTATGTLVGKQSYIAPEQFRGKSVPQSDIYALGATLYYYLTAEEPEPLSTLYLPEAIQASTLLREFISKCTAYKLEDRFGSIDDVAQCLQKLIAEDRAHVRI